MKVSIEAFGETEFAEVLAGFARRAEDMRPAWDDLHEDFLRLAGRQFDSQGRALSGGWRPLAPATRRSKRAAGMDPRILHGTLRLRRSFTSRSHREHVWRPGADGMAVGSRVPYGSKHQTGRGVPRRPLFVVTAAVRRDWLDRLQRHLDGTG